MTRRKGAYIGGFLGSIDQAQRVGSDVRQFYGLTHDMYTETFAASMRDIEGTAMAIDKSLTVTNSAGVMAAREAFKLGARPDELILVVGCMPVALSTLAMRSTAKTFKMPQRVGWERTRRFNGECMRETKKDLIGNTKHLFTDVCEPITETNTLEFAADAAAADVPTIVVYAQKDELKYNPFDTTGWLAYARNAGVTVALVPDAYHDSQLHDPWDFHEAAQNSRNHLY